MHIHRGIVPFVLIQIVALFPGLATWLPTAVFGR
jgi:hypothetical protein